ncbi:PREDICTED: heat shock protein beta-11-like [Nanorana parkeri]|uniref:heat shock protein beta-11-like n=1 Tax=Nanorana parkeri TaxID=125878 RepID=UPI0008544A7F|nr:PREDICTED: heat shock protein beta-11-like [Nanorana parkeri]
MLSLQLARSGSPSPLVPFLRPLWPLRRDIFSSLEQDMIHTVGEIRASMKLMELFHHQLLQESMLKENKTLSVASSSDAKTIKDDYILSLDIQDFSPKELTVKLLGYKLLVSGAKESKMDDGKGSFSYKCQIFRKEADLPQDVKAEDISCTVTTDGHLQIQAFRAPLPSMQERTVPIQLPAASRPKVQSSECNKDSRS